MHEDDVALLGQFVSERHESALAELVRRHVDLVYSAALRQTRGDRALAEDVTQEVFILLATKAASIRDGVALGGWLLVATRFAALNAMRGEARRRRHEHEAAAMKRDESATNASDDAATWQSVGPVLDEAIARLKRDDRDALALRYFQGRSVEQVAAALGVSNDAAQKRVWRAVEKLRDYFARRGFPTTPQGLANLLDAHAVASIAPAALVAKISASAASATLAGTSASSASAAISGKALVTVMAAATKTKIIAAAAACALLLGVTGTIAYQQFSGPRNRRVQVAPTSAAPAAEVSINGGALNFSFVAKPSTAPVLNWMAQLHKTYDLAPGESVKLVQPPFIADRLQYYKSYMNGQPDSATGPDAITFEFDGRTPTRFNLNWRRASYTGGAGGDLASTLSSVARIETYDTAIPRSLLQRQIQGDWVYRSGASKEQLAAALSQVINQRLGVAGSLVQKPIERDVIVVSGDYALKPVATTQPARPIAPGQYAGPAVHFFIGPIPDGAGSGIFRVTTAEFMRHLMEIFDRPVINEARFGRGVTTAWCDHDSLWAIMSNRADIAAQDQLFDNVTRQTGLIFKRERRVVPTWVWETTPTTAP